MLHSTTFHCIPRLLAGNFSARKAPLSQCIQFSVTAGLLNLLDGILNDVFYSVLHNYMFCFFYIKEGLQLVKTILLLRNRNVVIRFSQADPRNEDAIREFKNLQLRRCKFIVQEKYNTTALALLHINVCCVCSVSVVEISFSLHLCTYFIILSFNPNKPCLCCAFMMFIYF